MSETCTQFICTMGDVYALMAASFFILWGAKWCWDRRTSERRARLNSKRAEYEEFMVKAYLDTSRPQRERGRR
jgi:hypothetical protein